MRLVELLATIPDEELERLAIEHVRTDDRLPRPQLCNFLEGAIRSFRFVNDFVFNRQPPTFAILTGILESPGYQLPANNYQTQANAETHRISSQVDSIDLVARDDQLRLYRKALYEARRNDLDLNSSEAAILAVLRREQGIAQVEHFLIEHHQDLREFWDREDSFNHEMIALRSAGLVFERFGHFVIAEDVAPAIWQTLGIDMPKESARRLFGHLSNTELAEVLEAAGSRTSGTKELRLERVLAEWIQPRFALERVALTTLKEICRDTEASVSGNKDELVERVVSHFAQGKDQVPEEPVASPVIEQRQLSQSQFETMFSILQHQELSDILRRRPELRQTGTKETRIRTLWDANLSEQTLLDELMNRQLEDLLHRLALRLGGPKDVRIQRLIAYFGGNQSAALTDAFEHRISSESVRARVLQPEVLANRELFAQKASNPQASLQPWLENMLDSPGKVRCYATEDPNPTKQLKNKLSQAAAASEGLLVLILAHEDAFQKAREALLERWILNPEWSKAVAGVALAFPFSTPAVRTIINRTSNGLTEKLKERIFPDAEILIVSQNDDRDSGNLRCDACGASLDRSARFCSSCGTRIVAR